MEKSTLALIVGLAAATAVALAWGSRDGPATTVVQSVTAAPPVATEGEVEQDFTGELPPGHPPIDGVPGAAAMDTQAATSVAPADDEAAALTWKGPPGWALAPNPNMMRLATYKVAPDTEMIVARAGGDIEGNIKRWEGQFGDDYALKESHKTVRGLRVTIVEIDGTFKGGMGGGGSHDGWAMLAAIVETKGQPYFFKVVGPSAAVHGAAKAFDGMVDTFAPT